MNNISKTFFDTSNAELLFSITYKFIRDKFGYEIGDRGEIDLLNEIMKHIVLSHPNVSLRELNMKSLDMIKSIIVGKINEQRPQSQGPMPQMQSQGPMPQMQSQEQRHRQMQSQSQGPMPKQIHQQQVQRQSEHPQYTIQPSNISSSLEYEEETRATPEFIPDRPNFTEVLDNSNIDVHDAFSKLLQEREVVTEPEADLTKTSGIEILQDEPEMLKKFKEERESKITRDHYIVIDSRDRNHDSYLNPNSYRINLEQPLYNVLSMELISAEIPASQYLVNNSNNAIYFQETNAQVSAGTITTALVNIGNYTLSELKAAIESALVAASPTGANFSVDITTYSAQNKLSITSDNGGTSDLFNLLFSGGQEKYEDSLRTIYKENSIGSIIGFNREDKTGSLTYLADYQYSLTGDVYILLKLDDIKNIDGIASNVQDSFAKITLDTNANNIKYFKSNSDYEILKFMDKPIGRIDHFHLSFLTYNKDLYDFNGLEHSFTLKVSTLDHKY
jgi:hypothetical protein